MEVSVKCTTSVYLYDLSKWSLVVTTLCNCTQQNIIILHDNNVCLFFFPVKLLFKGDVKTASLFTVNVI